MNCNIASTVVMAMSLGFTAASAAQNAGSSPDNSNAAYLENLRRMQGYNALANEALRAPTGASDAAQAASQEYYEATPRVAPSPDSYAPAELVDALEVLLNSANLSPAQRARLVRGLQGGGN